MQEILAAIGNPHLNLPPTVHVAGTNGKGSTIAFLRAMLEAEGKTVHAYSTPHIEEFNERITLAGCQVSDDQLFEACETVRVAAEGGGLKLGFYEATTAAAFWLFARIPADFLLLETGVGGRLDATNIIPAPLLTIITTISLDHMQFLGETLEEIAWEKAQIIKSGTTVISSMQHDLAHEILEAKCMEAGVGMLCFGADFSVEESTDGMLFECQGDMMPETLQFSEPALSGPHQFINAASAVAAAMLLKLSKNSMEVGVVQAKLPSRMERLRKPFIPDDWEFWLDGGHNSGAAYALANMVLDEWCDYKKTYVIFGTSRGRDVAGFLSKFKDVADHVALVGIDSEPNSYDAEEMLEMVGGEAKSAHDNIKSAVEFLHKQNPQPARILCCGSLFMRGDLF